MVRTSRPDVGLRPVERAGAGLTGWAVGEDANEYTVSARFGECQRDATGPGS